MYKTALVLVIRLVPRLYTYFKVSWLYLVDTTQQLISAIKGLRNVCKTFIGFLVHLFGNHLRNSDHGGLL